MATVTMFPHTINLVGVVNSIVILYVAQLEYQSQLQLSQLTLYHLQLSKSQLTLYHLQLSKSQLTLYHLQLSKSVNPLPSTIV